MRIPTTLFLARTLASGAGSGFTPIASGTFGTAAAFLVWYLFRLITPTPSLPIDILLSVFITLVGVWASNICLATPLVAGNKRFKPSDPGYIVIDEWAGLFITLTAIPHTPALYPVLGFLLFRLFDVLKFGPVSWAERLPRGWGIMMDDVVAGLLSAAVLCAVRSWGT